LLFFVHGARRSAALDKHSSEYLLSEKGAKTGLPVIFRGNRTRSCAQFFWQRRPQHHEIQVTRVICKIDSLPRFRHAALPAHLHAAEAACQRGNDSRERMNLVAHFGEAKDFTSRSAHRARLKIVATRRRTIANKT